MRKLRKVIERGNPLWAATPKTAPDYYHEESTEKLFLSTLRKVAMITKLGLLKSAKADPPMGDRTGQPVVTSW